MADHAPIQNLSRRRFIQGVGAVGGTLLLGVQLPGQALAGSAKVFEPDVFIRLSDDGGVTILSHRSEMGQGIKSTLPRLVADEMEADWDKVTIEQAIGDAKYGSQNTDGSRSVRRFYYRLRQAGATARQMLEQAAAKHWGVKAEDCRAYNHEVTHVPSGRKVGYGDLVGIAAELEVPEGTKVALKPDDKLRYVGKENMALVDGKELVSGKAEYGYDVDLPGQKIAVIARPPVLFGTYKKVDSTETLKVPGVLKVIELPTVTAPAAFKPLGGVAVIAENTWAAIKGREKLNIEWDHGDNAAYSTDSHEQALGKSLDNPPHKVRKRGDWDKAEAEAAQVVKAEYYTAGLTHAMMEPPAAAARMTENGIEVFGCTQTPQSSQQTVAGILQLKPEQVTINVTYLGGGFGRKSKPDFMAEAAVLAKQSGWPVKVLWTREDEVRHGYYHSPSLQRMEASLDKSGKTTGWRHRMVMHPIGFTFNPAANRPGFENDLGLADMPYDIDNILIENGETASFQRIGWVRSVANISNVFALGSFVDEVAHAKGQDPKDHLLSLIGKDRHLSFSEDGYQYGNYGEPTADFPIDTARLKHVIELAAEKADWGRKLPKGHGLGIAAHRSFLSYVATVVEVSMNNGRVKIEKVHSAVDCGKAINPDRVRAQMEGAAVFGASLALYGEITLKDGIVEQGNFDDYPLARITDIGPTHVHLVESNERPAGIGEPGVPPFAPALANAIFAASGKRYRRLPLNQFDIV